MFLIQIELPGLPVNVKRESETKYNLSCGIEWQQNWTGWISSWDANPRNQSTYIRMKWKIQIIRHIRNLNIKPTKNQQKNAKTNRRHSFSVTNHDLCQTYLSNVVKLETFQRVGESKSWEVRVGPSLWTFNWRSSHSHMDIFEKLKKQACKAWRCDSNYQSLTDRGNC